MSKNKFSVTGDSLTIANEDWDKLASATIRDDYADELMSVTWSKNGEYLYSNKLKVYLHIFIMKKWYGDDVYNRMREAGCVVDHMDNNGFNCEIDNLSFLLSDENKAKGLTVDKLSKTKTHIALSMFNDFSTGLKQISIVFNYPAKAILSSLEKPAAIDLACLLYKSKYEIVINDARKILYDYYDTYTFDIEKLNFDDYHIEGCYGTPCPVERYDKYISGEHNSPVCFFVKKGKISNWTLEDKRCFFHLREI